MEEYICKYCGKSFTRKCIKVNHELHQCKKNPNVVFINYKQSESHKDLGKKGGWDCICGNNFRTRKLLKEHQKNCKKYLEFKGNSKSPKKYVEKNCPFCGKYINSTTSGYTLHVRTCIQNPNRVHYKGHSPSQKERQQISKKLKEYYKNTSIWATQLQKRKSYAEQYFDNCFPELKQNYHVLRYYLDLANPDKKVYLEIDGEQHYNDLKVVEHDKERTKLLEEAGWTLIDRIRWSEFLTFTQIMKEQKIAELKKKLL